MKRVVVVEDDVRLRAYIVTVLQECGYEVYDFGDGREAYKKVVECKPDAIILDLILPGMEGWDFTKEVRKWSKVPIIVITGLTAMMVKTSGYMEVDDILLKPFQHRDLLRKIKQHT